jgi:hypothetical protein
MHLKSADPDMWASSDQTENPAEATPTQLLSLAIKKRRSLYEAKEHDFRRELLHTGMIQTLCRFLGEGRARKRRRRRHRNSSSKKRRWDERSCTESEDEEASEHNGEWSGDCPISPKRSPDPHSQTTIQTRVGGDCDESNRSALEVVEQSGENTDRLVPDGEEVCEEGGPLKRLLRFDGAKDEHPLQAIQCYSDELFDQQLREESGELDPSYTLLC